MIAASIVENTQMLGHLFSVAERAGCRIYWQGSGAEKLALASADPATALTNACEPLSRIKTPIGNDPTHPVAIAIDFPKPFDDRIAERFDATDATRSAHYAAARAAMQNLELAARALPAKLDLDDLLDTLTAPLTYAMIIDDARTRVTMIILGWTHSPHGKWYLLHTLHLLTLLPQTEQCYVRTLGAELHKAHFRLLWRLDAPFALQPILKPERALVAIWERLRARFGFNSTTAKASVRDAAK